MKREDTDGRIKHFFWAIHFICWCLSVMALAGALFKFPWILYVFIWIITVRVFFIYMRMKHKEKAGEVP